MAAMRKLGTLESIPFRFLTNPTTNALNYFPDDLASEIAQWCPRPFEFLPEDATTDGPQLVAVQSIGIVEDAQRIWELRANLGPEAIIAVWLWDNHTAYIPNLRAAQAADLVFFSHSSHSDYLQNPASALVGHVPACSAQWRHDDAAKLHERFSGAARRSELLVNYVEYPHAEERNRVIAAVREGIPEAAVLSMPAGDRKRYFCKDRAERFAEWARHKTTLILPLCEDLSTRVFDALLCGVVPIVPTNIPDFDLVIPDEVQQELGIVRITSYEIDEIRNAWRTAEANFDRLGPSGVEARHRHVLDNHLLINRITELLQITYMLATEALHLRFRNGAQGHALYVGANAS